MKVKLLLVSCVMLGAVAATSCIKNEESDGVKAVRDAQALKLAAEAKEAEQNALSMAAADAISKMKADSQKALDDIQVKENELIYQNNVLAAAVTNAGNTEKVAAAVATAKVALVTAEASLAAQKYELELARATEEAGIIDQYFAQGLTADERIDYVTYKADLAGYEQALEDFFEPTGAYKQLEGDVENVAAELYGPGWKGGSISGLYGTATAFAAQLKGLTDALAAEIDPDAKALLNKQIAAKNIEIANNNEAIKVAEAELVKLQDLYKEQGKAALEKLGADIKALEDKIAALLVAAQGRGKAA